MHNFPLPFEWWIYRLRMGGGRRCAAAGVYVCVCRTEGTFIDERKRYKQSHFELEIVCNQVNAAADVIVWPWHSFSLFFIKKKRWEFLFPSYIVFIIIMSLLQYNLLFFFFFVSSSSFLRLLRHSGMCKWWWPGPCSGAAQQMSLSCIFMAGCHFQFVPYWNG